MCSTLDSAGRSTSPNPETSFLGRLWLPPYTSPPQPGVPLTQSQIDAGWRSGGSKPSERKDQQHTTSQQAQNAQPESNANNTRISGSKVGDGSYSIQFRIKEEDGKKRYIDGCYYTIYLKKKKSYPGSTTTGNELEGSANHRKPGRPGFTIRVLTEDSDEEALLYLGKRIVADGFPESRGSTNSENDVDEAPLIKSKVYPVQEFKVIEASTKRIWKPSFSQNGKDAIKREEQGIPYIYNDAASFRNGQKLRWNAPGGNPVSVTNSKGFTFRGNSTIGYGHLLHRGAVDPSNSLDAPYVERNVRGEDLTQHEMDNLYEKDLVERGGAGSGKGSLNSRIFVPLYQKEYDALVNQTFNGAANRGKIITLLNRGRYTGAGNLFEENKSAPPQRRQQQKNMFFKGEY